MDEPCPNQKGWLVLGGSGPRTHGYVVNNHGDRLSPLSRVVGPLPNGLFMAYLYIGVTNHLLTG